ncbi:MAG: cell division protein FtsK, partial [Phycisphaerae bacterium]
MPNLMNTQPDSLTTPTPEAGTQRDLQREALRELVLLSNRSADVEIEIEGRLRTARERAEAELHTALSLAEERLKAEQEAVEAKYREFQAQIAATHDSDLARLDAVQHDKRVEQEQDHGVAEQELKKKYAHAVWLAETLLEGAQAQVRQDSATAAEEYAARRQMMADAAQQGVYLMYALGRPWAAPDWPEVPSAADEDDALAGIVPDAPADMGEAIGQALSAEATERLPEPRPPHTPFPSLYDQVQDRLSAIAAMRFPRLFVGVTPFALTLLACGLAAGLTQVSISTTRPHFQAMGLAAVVALAVMVGGLLALRSVARRQVRQAADALRDVMTRAIDAAQAEHAYNRWQRRRRLEEALAKRDRDVREAKERYGPLMSKLAHDHEAFLAAQRAERDRLVAKIESRRELGLQEAAQWRQAMLAGARERHDRELTEARRRHDELLREARAAYAKSRRDLEMSWSAGLIRIQQPIDGRGGPDGPAPLDWNAPAWSDWRPPTTFSAVVRFGQMQVDLRQITDRVPAGLALPERFAVPALLAFPRQASLLISADHSGRADAIRALQTIMMRLLVCLPAGRVRFTLIDPVGLGQSFAGFMHLADYDESLVGGRIWTEAEHVERRLADLTEHMETVIQKYLRNEFQTIDEYNAQAGELAEPYRFLVIADFPAGFNEDSLRRLASIAGSGARCGVYTLIARDARKPLPAGVHLEDIAAAAVDLVQENGRFVWRDEVFRRFPLALDPPPPEDFLTRTLHVVGRAAREAKRVEVAFDGIAPRDGQTWSRSSESAVEVPIGRMGATRSQMLRLGRGVAQHGLIAGKTGSGKSTLLHVLITNLSLWYSPDEIEFYLVDFKKGVEFKAYATHGLPHARAVAVESDREFGLSVLQRVDAELTRRGGLFRGLGVQDLAAYRQTSGQKLPRTLLVIDEFQEFFSEDDRIAQDAGLLLDRLVRQGRAFGIHVLLGSQTIGGTSGLARSTIGQMAVRIALQTSEADSQIILGDGNSAARLLSRPGEAIYNDMSGLVEANSPFQVAWLPDERRDELLVRIRERAQREPSVFARPAVVFEGNAPGDLSKNEPLAGLIAADSWPEPTESPRVWL